jgi:hypothetical protein
MRFPIAELQQYPYKHCIFPQGSWGCWHCLLMATPSATVHCHSAKPEQCSVSTAGFSCKAAGAASTALQRTWPPKSHILIVTLPFVTLRMLKPTCKLTRQCRVYFLCSNMLWWLLHSDQQRQHTQHCCSPNKMAAGHGTCTVSEPHLVCSLIGLAEVSFEVM